MTRTMDPALEVFIESCGTQAGAHPAAAECVAAGTRRADTDHYES